MPYVHNLDPYRFLDRPARDPLVRIDVLDRFRAVPGAGQVARARAVARYDIARRRRSAFLRNDRHDRRRSPRPRVVLRTAVALSCESARHLRGVEGWHGFARRHHRRHRCDGAICTRAPQVVSAGCRFRRATGAARPRRWPHRQFHQWRALGPCSRSIFTVGGRVSAGRRCIWRAIRRRFISFCSRA